MPHIVYTDGTYKRADNASTKRPQYAVYWEKNGVDDYGDPTVASPVEVRVKIERGVSDILSPEGNRIRTDHAMNVDRKMVVGSIIWIRENPAEEETPAGDYLQIVDYEEISSLNGRRFDRWVKVVRYHDTLPTIV